MGLHLNSRLSSPEVTENIQQTSELSRWQPHLNPPQHSLRIGSVTFNQML